MSQLQNGNNSVYYLQQLRTEEGRFLACCRDSEKASYYSVQRSLLECECPKEDVK